MKDAEYLPALRKIIHYYESHALDYQLYNFSRLNVSLHFGLWDKKTHTSKHAILNGNNFLVKFSGLQAKDSVLDIGCGYGATAVWFASKIGCKVTGMTLGAKQVDAAKKFAQKKNVGHLTNFLDADFHNIPFPDNSFNVILAIESLCHAQNKIQVLRESYRVLKPGGRMIIADSFFKKDQNSLSLSEHKAVSSYLKQLQVPGLFNLSELQKTLHKSGFLNIGWQDKTNYILPALRQIQRLAPLFSFLSSALKNFGIHIFRHQHLQAFCNQYYSMKNGICVYGFWIAKKPPLSTHGNFSS